jgi:uncharacterized radical SAM superfamily Fe-S cluster-containing enzyme
MKRRGTRAEKCGYGEEGYRIGEFTRGSLKPLMAMIEVTNRCNMRCPVCFSGADGLYDDVKLPEIRRRLGQLLEVTETPVPLQISGGEPTLHPKVKDIVGMATSLGHRNIDLVTNGIKISRDPNLLPQLKEAGLRGVYLQFDGLKRETYFRIRGRDMTDVRCGAIEAVRSADLCCTLAVTVTRGINEGEIGDIVRFGIENIDVVRAINFQSATRFSGRFELDGKHGGYSLPELLNLIEQQTGVPADTFYSEHMGHPLCNAMSFVFLVNGKIEPLFKYISGKDVQSFLGRDGRDKVLGLFGGKTHFFTKYLSNPSAWKLIAKAAPIFGKFPLNVLHSKHILLFAKSFMERNSLDAERVKQCCYAITDTGGVFSFCAFNNLYRFSKDVNGTRKNNLRTLSSS